MACMFFGEESYELQGGSPGGQGRANAYNFEGRNCYNLTFILH